MIFSLLLFNVWFQLTEFKFTQDSTEIIRFFRAICVVLNFLTSVLEFSLNYNVALFKTDVNANPWGIVVVINLANISSVSLNLAVLPHIWVLLWL